MRISVVTDSSACLPADTVRGLDLRVLPIAIRTPSEELADGMPGASRRVYEALQRGEPVKSSAPTALEYLTAIEEAPGDAVVIITPAVEFTGMWGNAWAATDLAERPAVVVDSRTAAAAQGLVALEACEAAASGSLQEVVATAEDAARRADLVASLPGVEHVRRSGRVPLVALNLAGRLGVRPVFRLHQGAVERLGVPRSWAAARERMRREWTGTASSRSAVFHAADPDAADELSLALGGVELVTEFSPSMGIHTGPGVVGVAWLRPAAA